MADQIAIISIPVSFQGGAKNFYVQKLGFKVVRDDPMGGDRRWVELRPRGGGPSITLVTWFDKMPAGSQQGLVLTVDDIDARRAEIAAAGVAISEVQGEPPGRFATLSDPDGNGWVLQQAT